MEQRVQCMNLYAGAWEVFAMLKTIDLAIVLMILCDGCSGSGGDTGSHPSAGGDGGITVDAGAPRTSTRVTGRITLPAAVTNRCAMVAVDSDTTGANGSARRGDGSYLLAYVLVNGATLDFDFADVPAGTYYLWGFVDTNASSSSPGTDCEMTGGPNSGDDLGYFDTGLAPPGGTNVTVPHDEGRTFPFTLGVFP